MGFLLVLAFSGLMAWVFWRTLLWGYGQDDGTGGGWWGRPPKVGPPGPPPLPKKWSPPDHIPEWVLEEQLPKVLTEVSAKG